MRVLILADRSFAGRERAMLARLEVGLVDAGVRVVHAVPESGLPEPDSEALATAITYRDSGPPLTLGARAGALVEQLTGPKTEPIDVVHVFGGRAWSFAARVAEILGSTLIIEVWRAGLIARAKTFATANEKVEPVFCSPDREIARALSRELRGADARHTPWGVITPTDPSPILADGRAPALLLGGGGHQPEAIRAALEGLGEARRVRPSLLAIVDADAAQRAELWQLAGRLQVREALSLIDNVDLHRDVTLHVDLVLWPEALGEHHCLVLDAMAHGLPVLAAPDPMNASLIDGRTCRLVAKPTRDAWAHAIADVLDDPAAARALGQSARAFVKDNHRASGHVSAVLGLYESNSVPDPIRLDRTTT